MNNEYHKRVHNSPNEWGKRVSKRNLERHPLYSPGSLSEKRLRSSNGPEIELDDIEEMIRQDVLEILNGQQQLCKTKRRRESGNNDVCSI